MNFCSRVALGAHEALAGTGVRGSAYAFLPVPKRFWRDQELNSAWASRAEIEAVRAARRAGVVTRLYNPPAEPEGHATLVCAPEHGGDTDAVQALLAVFAGRWPGQADPGPRLAVCTHGTRDRCCAKWGFAVYAAARRLFAEGRSPFEPMECSHLGGDRFAATGLVLPSGSMYAHLDALDLQALVQAEAAGRILPDYYRGRVFEPQLTQVVRAGLARQGLYNQAAAPLEITRPEGRAAVLRVTAEGGRLRFLVSLTTQEVSFFPDCHDLAGARLSTARRTVFAGATPAEA